MDEQNDAFPNNLQQGYLPFPPQFIQTPSYYGFPPVWNYPLQYPDCLYPQSGYPTSDFSHYPTIENDFQGNN